MNTTLNFSNKSIQFVGASSTSLFRVWIQGEKGKGVNRITMHGPAMGIIHAFTDMVKLHRYSFHETGLHLRPSVETLAMQHVAENIGYVSNRYDGDLPIDGLEKLEDTNFLMTNWGTVNFADGRLFVGKKITYVKGELGEAEYIGHERNAINLMNGFDAVLSGSSFNLEPKTRNHTSVATGEVVAAATRIANELAKCLQVLEASDDDAQVIVREAVVKSNARRAYGRELGKAYDVVADGKQYVSRLVEVSVITCQEPLTIEKKSIDFLEGKSGWLFKGTTPASQLQDLSNATIQNVIRKMGLAVLIQE